MQARVRGLVVLALVPVVGCSFALTRRPPPLPLASAEEEVRCTEGDLLPYLELGAGAVLTVFGVAAATYRGVDLGPGGALARARDSRSSGLDSTGGSSSVKVNESWLAVGGAGLLLLASGIYGKAETARCREIKAHARDCRAGDASVCAVLLHTDNPPDWSLPEWLGREQGRRSTSSEATSATAPPASGAPAGAP